MPPTDPSSVVSVDNPPTFCFFLLFLFFLSPLNIVSGGGRLTVPVLGGIVKEKSTFWALGATCELWEPGLYRVCG